MTSFEFEWDKHPTKAIKGTAFARKRKNKADGSKADALSVLSNKSKSINKPPKVNKPTVHLLQKSEPREKIALFKAVQSVEESTKLPSSKSTTLSSGNLIKHKNKTNETKADTLSALSNKSKNINKPLKIDKPTVNLSQNSKPTKKGIPFKVTQKLNENITSPQQSTTFSSGLIKRKKRKDKQSVKLQNSTSEDTTIQNVDNHYNQAKKHSLFSEKHKTMYVNVMSGKSVVEKIFSEGQNFCNLDIHKYIVANLQKINFDRLTTVQEKSIPVVSSGKNVLIRSQTGSGKTLAYAVPILDSLHGIEPKLNRNDGVQAIIIVPTRELALQTHELFEKINTFQWIVVGHLCGGENRKTEKDRLRKGVHILIATPGRLLDHILHTEAFKVHNVRCLVLDEADRLLDMGFKRDIVSIVEELDKSKKYIEYNPLALLKKSQNQSVKNKDEPAENTDTKYLPPLKNPSSKDRQTLLLSATLTKDIAELANFIMKDHVYIDALDTTIHTERNHMVIPNSVKQEFIMSYVKHRLFTLSALLVEKSKHNSKVFVFMATSQMVDYHYELFTRCLVRMPRNRGKLKSGNVVFDEDFEDSEDEEEVLDIQFFRLHGSMDQSARKQIFTGFRAAKKGVLLCTDVAARGLDVPTADCIVQYNGPQSDEDYLHRVGRTGRAGKSGHAIIFLTHEEQEYLTRLQQYKVFLKKIDSEEYLNCLCDVMEEPEQEKAASALQKRYEDAVAQDKGLQKKACLAYTSWSRFYNTYPTKMRSVFNFKNVNLGHYVTSFALRLTPTMVAKTVRGQFVKQEPRRLNKKLATHDDQEPRKKAEPKKKIKSRSTMSEYESGLEFLDRKKKKRKVDE